ncbi:hypothetical protein HanRHA438_Chr13g0596941 [Helianthus annuus]|uniref:Uncharacterized protein n=1 Tax=Helianthus annuus TaxID=4232 RepID=A0A9K3EHK9_HELAN|nr:hypothetical protein HanXRQr2_Chr13g0586251 [Helianthus annuus]KAJ0497558.1 hypothetical protein HanHA89_Chr13g0512671 [Helianthus annuus]KAJ0663568.1 hypothetical protein HanLR1_Chr13g0482591 [Helianthus annuus]KAJ0671063.1 hypothetical protein HanOQP8_Chr13g0481501 [Helianthus annuus]KAJ0849037.1 hypothetical protein HanPSC8_Chr13g0564351 [Helianthus annuus]
MENVEYGWGVGSVVAMLLVVGCLLFLPLGMGPVLTPPSIPALVLVPVFLVVDSKKLSFHLRVRVEIPVLSETVYICLLCL